VFERGTGILPVFERGTGILPVFERGTGILPVFERGTGVPPMKYFEITRARPACRAGLGAGTAPVPQFESVPKHFPAWSGTLKAEYALHNRWGVSVPRSGQSRSSGLRGALRKSLRTWV
jgi:hypothetical protein